MEDVEVLADGPGDLTPLRALALAAAAVHGSAPLDEKLAWVLQTGRALTSATLAAYVDLGGDAGGVATVIGGSVGEVERFARPAVTRLFADEASWTGLHREADLAGDARYVAFLDRGGLGAVASSVLIPVVGADVGLHGVLLLCHPHPQAFDRADEEVAAALGSHLGVALDNLETMTRMAELQAAQREVVHQLQEAVRPPMPTVEGVELGVHYLPADPSAPTGGDLYDWMVLPDGDVHLAVVDVMGKGVGATKDAVGVTHALRLLVLDGCPMDRLVARTATLVTAPNPELVATVMVARYRPSTGEVHLAGGGHPPALVVSGDGRARFVAAPGVTVGYPGAGSTEVATFKLRRRDALILFTDGLIEATKDVLAGLDAITVAATQTAQYPAAHLARALVQRALSGAMRRDDSLALVLRRRTPPHPSTSAPLGPFEYRFSPTPATIPLGRHLFADWLEHLAVDEAERADLLLVASELCSNAVRHASGSPGALCLRGWAEGDSVVIEVEDDGTGFELRGHYDDEPPDPDAEVGRGLYVAEALSDDITVTRAQDRTVVRALRRAILPGGAP